MAALNSKNQICNLTLSLLGNYGTVSDIDTPINDKEVSFAQWYDISRQTVLKLLMPNFARVRDYLALSNTYTPKFGYSYAFPYPQNCLKLLGVGNIDDKDYDYRVEGAPNQGGNFIVTRYPWPDGLPVRYLQDITDVNLFSPEFVIELAFELAPNVALAVTQDQDKADKAIARLPAKRMELSAVNAQENRPVRKSVSRFKAARYRFQSTNSTRVQ